MATTSSSFGDDGTAIVVAATASATTQETAIAVVNRTALSLRGIEANQIVATTTNDSNNNSSTNDSNEASLKADDDDLSIFSEVQDNSFCMAKYYPPASENSNIAAVGAALSSSSSSPIWWPAIQFSSVSAFEETMRPKLLEETKELVRNGTMTKQRARRIEDLLGRRVMTEKAYRTEFHTLYYVSRPLWEYRTADPKSSSRHKKPIKVEHLSGGLAMNAMKLCHKPWCFPSKQIYVDFHRAIEQAIVSLIRQEDDSDDDDGNDDALQEQQQEQPKVLELAMLEWEKWEQDHPQQYGEQPSRLQALAAAGARDDPQNLQEEAEEQDHDEGKFDGDHAEREVHHFAPADHGSPMAQSIAAVSYTDASLESARTNHTHTPRRNSRGERRSSSASAADQHTPAATEAESMDLPPKLSPIAPKASFDQVWHKFHCDGWDMYQDSETQQMVYQAPNGYSFASLHEFQHYLQAEYGWEPPLPPRKTRRQRQSSVAVDARSISSTKMWSYVKHNLGWQFFSKPRDIPGLGTWVYYRPGFHNKNRGILGKDHFLDEEEVLEYCLANDIKPPPSPGQSTSGKEDGAEAAGSPETADREEEEASIHTDDEEEGEDDVELEGETPPATADGEDSGYETPTGQTPTPQDPGRPLERDDSPVSDQEDVEDPYIWKVLWESLKKSGWEITKPTNELDDWWYCKPVRSMNNLEEEEEGGDDEIQNNRARPLKPGVDYFVSPQEVIAFCKERDNIRRGKQKKLNCTASARPAKRSKTCALTAPPTAATEAVSTKGTKKRDRENKKASKKKKSAEDSRNKKPRSDVCGDDDLKVHSSANSAPWARNPPLFEHSVVIGSSAGISYQSPYYYLPGESPREFTERFENTTDLVQGLVKIGNFNEPGDKDSTSFDHEFGRYIRYAFVSGKPSEWSIIRMITDEESRYLLQKAEYCSSADGSWKPPTSLVDSGLLRPTYLSFESLCEDLRSLPDLESSSEGSRRRKRGNLSARQTLALQLAIAEGCRPGVAVESPARDLDDTSERSIVCEKEAFVASEEKAVAGKKSDKGKKKRHQNDSDVTDDSNVGLSNSKVKFDDKTGKINPAPWVSDPFLMPADGWHKCYKKMGWKSVGGNRYSYPGVTTKVVEEHLTKTSDLQEFICTEGKYDKYLSKLSEQERVIVRRHFNYAHVPGSEHHWKNKRKLTTEEVIVFLNRLGFEKDANGQWKIPTGLPTLKENETFPSLSALGRALVRVSDLEDRCGGMGNRRRARKADLILNEHQMMALRLRLAEGLDDEEGAMPIKDCGATIRDSRSSTEATPKSSRPTNEAEANEQGEIAMNSSSEEVSFRAIYEVCSHAQAWKYLQVLGCKHYSTKYHLPHDPSFCPSTQNELVEHILEKSVSVLDWECSTLSQADLKDLEFYLRCFNAKLKFDSPVGEANMLLKEDGMITKLLDKLGITRLETDVYTIRENSEEYTTSEIVNKIRCASDLYSLSLSPDATPRRRRSNAMLTDKETLAVRLWSIKVEVPLNNFPTMSQNVRDDRGMGGLKGEDPDVTITAMSKTKVSNMEEIRRGDTNTADTDYPFPEATIDESVREVMEAKVNQDLSKEVEYGTSVINVSSLEKKMNSMYRLRPAAEENELLEGSLHEDETPVAPFNGQDTFEAPGDGVMNAESLRSPLVRNNQSNADVQIGTQVWHCDIGKGSPLASSFQFLSTQPDEGLEGDPESCFDSPSSPKFDDDVSFSLSFNAKPSARRPTGAYGNQSQHNFSPSDSSSPLNSLDAPAENASAANSFGFRNLF